MTLPDALAALNRLFLQHYAFENGTMITRLPRLDSRQRSILEALHVTLPKGQKMNDEHGFQLSPLPGEARGALFPSIGQAF